MASNSPIAAVRALYGTLTAANFPGASRPPLYFGEVPLYDGQQVRPPYCVLIDNGLTPAADDFEGNVIEDGRLILEVYADTLEDVDAILKAVKYNGQAPGSKAGFDYARPALNSPYAGMVLERTGPEVRRVAGIGLGGQRTHMARVGYTFRAQVVA